MARPWIENQTIEYDVLYALENGKHQVWQIRRFLRLDHNKIYSPVQIGAALQRIRKAGLAKYDCRWDREYG